MEDHWQRTCKEKDHEYGKTEIVKKREKGTFEEGQLKHPVSKVKRCNFCIVALQETKQAGELVMKVGEYIFINSGGTDRMLGAGFIISKKWKSLIVQFNLVSNKICLLRLIGKYQKITLINIHAPHDGIGTRPPLQQAA
ncbi:hypothetical protein NQ315_010996 [Exocentrus adspersus]|uniref:Uncharacterized protein n=1 Tax=Exocentrus adspersus TaxID=1586481 RepID=A0AAV8VJB0_9CUCU|nr:hypothetical protein NQ315_010996 [Exocentrus adspersus]